ncbi:MAG: fumarylacetoacetate hydrolase family protein [Chloroflexi bacterium]|nr:fumarylacetoacetate hydrolase family protein [Chloroflexota bacterium]MCI0726887.1 fumarylacetoacetate hydrolase family protein [Chloroflexota bacterium]
MKWVHFSYQGRPTYGLLSGAAIQLTGHTWPDILSGQAAVIEGEIEPDGVALLNPIGRPGKIVCVGLNYLDHCRETNTPPPERPLLFAKFTTSVNDPSGDIVWSRELTTEVDFEAELAVIIGRRCRQAREAEALAYVAGYTAANDVSARDLQMGDGQWVRGKSLDTFCPLGPAFVTAEEIPDPQRLAIRSILNGAVMQNSHTGEMIFSVASLIAFCSQAFTLEPGDVILTGTPHGVGLGRNPRVYMQDGDVIVIEIEGIGRLENRCRVI